MDKKLKSIFSGVYEDHKSEETQDQILLLKNFEKKIFQLLYVIRDTKKHDKSLQNLPQASPEQASLKLKHQA